MTNKHPVEMPRRLLLLLAVGLLALGGCGKIAVSREYTTRIISVGGEDKFKIFSAKEMIAEYLHTLGRSVGASVKMQGRSTEDCDRKMRADFQDWISRIDHREIDTIVENTGLNTMEFLLECVYYDEFLEEYVPVDSWHYQYQY